MCGSVSEHGAGVREGTRMLVGVYFKVEEGEMGLMWTQIPIS